VDAARAAIARGDPAGAWDEVDRLRAGLLQPVINGTGVLLHTNLGRAPLEVALPAGAVNLELSLASGRRSARHEHVGGLLARACGAEAALVVNNGASAVLLALAALAAGRPVVVSRGELVEIGGGFRIPEIMDLSGARLVEVGTTNKTRLADYRRVADDAALVLKVHASNYRIEGFTSATSIAELSGLAPPILFDLGSGLLDAACPWLPGGPPPWLRTEPAVRQALQDGAALVTFSGDKLLGGPQAGVLAGRADLVARCARHPLYRVTRPGALVLGALQEVALAYLERRADELPFWRMATIPVDVLQARAEALAGAVPGIEAGPCASVAGGGALPGVEIPSWGVRIRGDETARLRRSTPRPIIAVVRDGATVIDLRTVAPPDDAGVAAALAGPEG
jgi:L-seryl-tRNA(Ser) seleniumtransferase